MKQFEEQKSSKILSINDFIIGDEGCEVLSEFLMKNKEFSILEFKGNNISSKGLAIICESLKENEFVEEILGEWNLFGNSNEGFIALKEILAKNKSIKKLDFQNNQIGPNSAPILGEIISMRSNLKSINLKWNELGIRGARILIEALKKNSNIIEFDISCNRVTQNIIQEVDNILRGFTEINKNEEIVKKKLNNSIEKDKNRFLVLEKIIDEERKRTQKMEKFYENELQSERNKRIELENKLLEINNNYLENEEFLQRENAKANDFMDENRDLHEKIEFFEKKLIEMENSNIEEIIKLKNSLECVINERDELRNNQQQEINSVYQENQLFIKKVAEEWEWRYNELDKKFRNLKEEKFEIDRMLHESNENINRLNKNQESTIKEAIFNSIHEERNKYEKIFQDFERKLLSVEQVRDHLFIYKM